MSKKGFKPVNRRHDRTINVGELKLQLDRLTELGFAKSSNGKIEVDLSRAGYDKLLGDGALGISNPLRILVSKSSEKAVEKIGGAGGEVVLPAKPKEE